MLSLVVMSRVSFKESLYVYLKVLSVADLVTVMLVMFSVLAQSVGHRHFWLHWIDVFVHLPLGSISITTSIVILMAVTLERLLVIRQPIKSRRWRTRRNARKVCVGIIIFSLTFNVPYFFSYRMENGEITRTEFSASQYYNLHNWLRLILLAITPGIFLLVGNMLFILSLSRFRRDSTNAMVLNDTSNSVHNSNIQDSSSSPDSRKILQHNVNTGEAKGAPHGKRRCTLASLSNTEIMVQIQHLQKSWIVENSSRDCSRMDEWQQSVTINLLNPKLCPKCNKIQHQHVTQNFGFSFCACEVKRSHSLPACLTESSGKPGNMNIVAKHDRNEKNKSMMVSPSTQATASSRKCSDAKSSSTTLSYQETAGAVIRFQKKRAKARTSQRRVTLVLVAMICSFLVGEAPTHLVSRTTTQFHSSTGHLGHPEITFRLFKLTVTILMAMHYSFNFFLYLALNKRFARQMHLMFGGWARDQHQNGRSGSTS
ncbi:G protein-coupled receptor rhodopsin-like [Trinorchestia longiramus]|nr:G protein-coupled receptor rhodopsin-like [Trinorchestia longiramus]